MPPPKTLLLREAAVVRADGRTLVLDLLGFGVPYPAADRPDLGPYQEVWQPGAFRQQATAAHRIGLMYRHRHGTEVGRGQTLEETGGRLVATFRLTDAPGLVRELIADGLRPSIGFECRPAWEHVARTPAGTVVTRTRGLIHEASLTPDPAYPDARALALREAAPPRAGTGAGRAAAWRLWVDLHNTDGTPR